MHRALSLTNEEIADIFKKWNSTGELEKNFLIDIGEEALRFKHGDEVDDSKGIVEDIEDKVVQDVDNSEGTGVWTLKVNGIL